MWFFDRGVHFSSRSPTERPTARRGRRDRVPSSPSVFVKFDKIRSFLFFLRQLVCMLRFPCSFVNSPAAGEGVLSYREGGSGVWSRNERGNIEGRFGGFPKKVRQKRQKRQKPPSPVPACRCGWTRAKQTRCDFLCKNVRTKRTKCPLI